MKKFTKQGHLQGNTSVSLHGSPFLQGSIPVNGSGNIQAIEDLTAPWNLALYIENDNISFEVDFSDSGAGANLEAIVTAINTDAQNTHLGVQQVVASVRAGALRLETVTAGDGSFIRINPAPSSSYPSAALYFGFTEHPHSQATVRSGDITSSSADTLGQQNPTGTSFIARGEDRSSESYNRALASLAVNASSNRAMLDKGLGVSVTLKLEVDTSNPSFVHDRWIIDSAFNTITGIDLSDNISGDPFNSLLSNRCLVGILDKDSTVGDLRKFYFITDHQGKEISFSGKPVRVSAVTSGFTPSYQPPSGPLTLESQPMLGLNNSTSVGDVGIALSADIPRGTGSQNVNITNVIDKHTLVCGSATFITAGVAAGDKVVISGSTASPVSNNGSYLVENVISETTLELAPYDSNSVQSIQDSATGSVSVSTGGMWLKNPTIWLTEPIQLPLNHDLYLTIPLEEPTGDLPEDALLRRNSVEVPFWITQNLFYDKSLDGSYKGTSADRDGGGYFIDADSKPIEILSDNASDKTTSSVRTISNVSILADNVLQILLTSSDSFSQSDVGRIVFLTVNNPSPPITDSIILGEEPVVIVQLLDSKNVVVRRTSRNTQNLPIQNVSLITIKEDDFHPFLPNDINFVSYSTESSGSGIIDESPNTGAISSRVFTNNISIERIGKLSLSAFPEVVSKINLISATEVEIANSDSSYLAATLQMAATKEYVPSALLRIYNGVNSGFYLIRSISSGSAGAVFTLLNTDGTAVVLTSVAYHEFASIYRITEANSMPGEIVGTDFTKISKFVSVAPTKPAIPATGLEVAWRAQEGTGISVKSPLVSSTDILGGLGASGSNIYVQAGPGTSGINVSTIGIEGFDSANMLSDAEISLSSSEGRGKIGVLSASSTFNYTYTPTVPKPSYVSGAGFFRSFQDDPSLVVGAAGPFNVPLYNRTTSVFNAKDDDTVGSSNLSAEMIGSVYVASKDTDPTSVRTESTLSAVNVVSESLTSEEFFGNISTNTVVMNRGIIGRVSSNNDIDVTATIKNADTTLFRIPHLFVLVQKMSITFGDPGTPPTYPNLRANKAHTIGASLFIIKDDTIGGTLSTSYTDLVNSLSLSSKDIQFNMNETTSGVLALSRMFKICAFKQISTTEIAFAITKTSYDESVNITDPTAKISCVMWRQPAAGNVDINEWSEIGAEIGRGLSGYQYDSTDSKAALNPLLYSKKIDSTGNKNSTVYMNLPLSSLGYTSNSVSGVNRTDDLQSAQGRITDIQYWGNNVQNEDTLLSERYSSGFKTDGSGDKNLTTTAVSIRNTDCSISSTSVSTGVTKRNSAQVVGSNGIKRETVTFPFPHNTNWFKGGGRKLVLHSMPWADNSPVTKHELELPIDYSIFSSSSSFTVEIMLAHFSDETKPITAQIRRGSTVLAEVTKNIYYSSNTNSPFPTTILPKLYSRTYKRQEFSFKSLDIYDIARAEEFEELPVHLRIIVETKAGLITRNENDLGTSSDEELLELGRALYNRWTRLNTFSHSSSARDLKVFPDAVFIRDIKIFSNKKQAVLTSGLDVHGSVRATTLRLRNPVYGYEVVTPAKVDLLQNTEYGNKPGNGRLYDETVIGPITETDSSINLEGNDVGLLPLWKASLFVPRTDIAEDVGNINASTNTEYDFTGNPITWTNSLGDEERSNAPSVYFLTSSLTSPLTLKSGMFVSLEGSGENSIEQGFFTTSVRAGLTNDEDFGEQQDTNIFQYKLFYRGSYSFVCYYRPIFDRNSFFRKGTHSAAIHAYHPYFDPMFYWEHAAVGINKQKSLSTMTNFEDTNTVPDSQNNYRWDIGSFRAGTGQSYTRTLDSRVNPEVLKLPGKTGFIVPIEPPHGSILKTIDLKMSFRPLVTRKLDSSTEVSTSHYVDYCVWHSLPDKEESQYTEEYQKGTYWQGREKWVDKEGYVVKLWRHSPFSEGYELGDINDNDTGSQPPDPVFSTLNKEMDGNATLLLTKTVHIRRARTYGGGECGSPAAFVNDVEINEAISRFKLDLGAHERFVIDRANYGYFITIEFYCGVRKVRDLTYGANSTELECYTVPGHTSDIDAYNKGHFPYMWTPAMSHKRPRGMSSIYGNDEASMWEGLWVPHGNAKPNSRYPQAIYRRHPANQATHEVNVNGTETTDFLCPPTPDSSKVSYDPGTFQAFGDTNVEIQAGDAVSNVITRNTNVPNQQIWYPVVKFRGLRIKYAIDRPGHGGWGG